MQSRWRKAIVRLLVMGLGAAACALLAGAANDLTTLLIVPRANLPDPNFKDSVVLVMNNLGPAPAGLIVNRPTRVTVAQLFPDLPKLSQSSDKVYFGGPVDIAAVTFLVRAATPPEHAVRVLDGLYLSTDGDLLRSLLARDKPMEGLRIFVGYAGWGPGQLEGEIARGDWTLTPADAGAIFGGTPEHPWPAPAEAESGRPI
jgi:putative transcriptional regulator